MADIWIRRRRFWHAILKLRSAIVIVLARFCHEFQLLAKLRL